VTVTSGHCTVLAGNTSITVTHGYGDTPTSVWAQPKDDLGGRSWHIPDADIGALTFKLYITSMDIGSDHLFRWICAKAEMTEGNAQIVAGDTSVVVNHGYGSAPTGIWVTPKEDLGGRDWWLDTITATQFTLHISTDDPFEDFDFRFMCGSLGSKTVEGNATVLAGSTSIVVNHGFGEVVGPACVWVMPLEELGGRQFYVDTASPTQFTLTISTSDPFEDFSFRFFCYDAIGPGPGPGITGEYPVQGLYAQLFLADGTGPVGTANTVQMLTALGLSWGSGVRRWYEFGQLEAADLLDGPVSWQGKFERAFFTNKYLGSFKLGTVPFIGSIMPIGGTHPAIGGTIIINGGTLTGMTAENESAVYENVDFVMYNLSFVD